jgi:hypothetical protein
MLSDGRGLVEKNGLFQHPQAITLRTPAPPVVGVMGMLRQQGTKLPFLSFGPFCLANRSILRRYRNTDNRNGRHKRGGQSHS